MMYRLIQKMLLLKKKRAKQQAQTVIIKVTFKESIVSILDELEGWDFDRNELSVFQFTIVNTRNQFWRGTGFGSLRSLHRSSNGSTVLEV